jgi:REP element-mobilizing transposase RayT
MSLHTGGPRSLKQIRKRYVFHLCGFVLMPEQVHLMVSKPMSGVLDRAIPALKVAVSRQSIQRYFWLARYYDFFKICCGLFVCFFGAGFSSI